MDDQLRSDIRLGLSYCIRDVEELKELIERDGAFFNPGQTSRHAQVVIEQLQMLHRRLEDPPEPGLVERGKALADEIDEALGIDDAAGYMLGPLLVECAPLLRELARKLEQGGLG